MALRSASEPPASSIAKVQGLIVRKEEI